MIDEHRLFIAAMSFLAAYFAILLIVATAEFVIYHHALNRRVRLHLIEGREKVQADEDGDPRQEHVL